MPVVNNFKSFAGGVGANVLTQPQYEALATLLATGFTSGVAPSVQLNKVWRQSSIMASVLAQFIADVSGQDSIDDGTTATLLVNMKTAIRPIGSLTAHATGTADALIGIFSPVPSVTVDGLSYFVRAAFANATATPTFTSATGIIAPAVIVKGNSLPLVPGDIAGVGHWLELQYDSALARWVLQNPATGVSIAPASVAQAQAQTSDAVVLTPLKLANALQGANQSLAASGFQKLPGGLILQWGVTASIPTDSSLAITFPLAFPTACFVGFANSTSVVNVSGVNIAGGASGFTTAGMSINNDANPAVFTWFAIGH